MGLSFFRSQAFAVALISLTVLIAAIFYALHVGVVALWPDALHYADRARHMLEEGRMAVSAGLPQALPLYSFLMMLGFVGGDIEKNHAVITIVQALALAAMFFPLHGLLLKQNLFNKTQTALLAGLVCLSPSFLPYVSFLTPQLLATVLIVIIAFYVDVWLEKKNAHAPVFIGFFLAVLLLLHPSGLVVYAALLLTMIPLLCRHSEGLSPLRRQGGFFSIQWPPTFAGVAPGRALAWMLLLPLVPYALWLLLSGLDSGGFNLNNALARFNFLKNGILYILYAGVPLAGMAFILTALFKRKTFWGQPFFHFVFWCLLGALIYAAFAMPVVVERKLNYVAGFLLDPFLALPLVVLLRLDAPARREALANGLLLFFVLLIFGLPFNLLLDVKTGLAYWAQSLSNPNLGVWRNMMYLLLIMLPAAVHYMKPKYFPAAFIVAAVLFAWSGAAQNSAMWKVYEDSNFKTIEARTFYALKDLKAAPLYTDAACVPSADPATLFRCYDVMKARYFLPALATIATADDVLKLNTPALFLSAANDNALGPVVAQAGLARMVAITPGAHPADAPLVQITAIDGLHRYINTRYHNIQRRLTGLDRTVVFHLHADKAGCATMQFTMFMDDKPRPASFTLNDQKPKTLVVPYFHQEEEKMITRLELDLPQGPSMLKLSFGAADEAATYNLMLLDRPLFAGCAQ